MNITDTSGQEEYNLLLPEVIKKSQIFIVVYSIIKKNSFEDLQFYIEKIRENKGPKSIIIVGNKIDLENKREVEKQKGEAYALKNGFLFSESSAKTGENIHEIFQKVILDFLPKLKSKK